MEEEDAQDDGKEPAYRSHDAVDGHVEPFFKKDGWAGHDGGGEEDIVDGSNYGRVEDVKRFVQVVNLYTDTDHQADD